MQKVYLKYPEITSLKANIVSRRAQGDKTQLILDRTIFMPSTPFLIADKGDISGLEILGIEEKRDNIIHLVKGKPQKSEVVLNLGRDPRYRNLSYNTAWAVFSMIMDAFYNFKDIRLELTEASNFELVISEFYDDLDIDLIQNQMNLLIQSGLKITNQDGITSIPPIGEVINNGICFDNTAKVLGFKIINQKIDEESISLEILAGRDILK